MKDGIESPVARTIHDGTQEEFTNRKLIRPSLNSPPPRTEPVGERRERLDRGDRGDRGPGMKKSLPTDQTHAENFYYQKQIQAKTPLAVVLKDGEQVQGVIEWYDRNCIRLARTGGTSLLIYKPAIRYIYKVGEATQS
jgi:RNA chaperone Hfq